jgi:hypothetical protein
MLRHKLSSIGGGDGQWEIQVIYHSEERSACELAALLYDSDVLVTPHGFQSMLLIFLPLPSIFFEVFPYRYYKNCYSELAENYGIGTHLHHLFHFYHLHFIRGHTWGGVFPSNLLAFQNFSSTSFFS